MISKDIVRDIVRSFIAGSDIFIVDVKVNNASRIVVEVDKPAGITIEECVNISRSIESALNRETEDFELEVSSPGITEPFKVIEQYRKNCGRQVEILDRDGLKVSGLLQSVDNEGIILETKTKIREKGLKRPKTVIETLTIKFSDIKTARQWII